MKVYNYLNFYWESLGHSDKNFEVTPTIIVKLGILTYMPLVKIKNWSSRNQNSNIKNIQLNVFN